MKNNYFFLLISSFLIFSACREEPILIPRLGGNVTPNPSGTTVSKKILVEEFTGAGCVNCPDGAAALNNLHDIYKEKLILLSIHAGFFTKKSQLPKEAKFDFTTSKGNELQLFLGEPAGYPAAVINRKVREADGSLVAGSKDQWAGLVQQESKETTNVAIVFKNGYDESTRKWQINTQFDIKEDLVGTYSYTVMIVEDKIVDAQKTPNGVKVDYVHRHVLRDILTAAQGDAITEKLTKGTSIGRSLTYTLPNNFDDKNCEVLVVLHKTGTNKEVVQVEVQKVK
jgi:hypothetical protein